MEIVISVITLVCVAIAAFAAWKARKANEKILMEIATFVERYGRRGENE